MIDQTAGPTPQSERGGVFTSNDPLFVGSAHDDGGVKPDGARARGGPVEAGKTYVINENGLELLHMGPMNGTVLPNGSAVTAGASGTDRGGKRFAEAFGEELSRSDGIPRRFAEALGEGLISKMRTMFGMGDGSTASSVNIVSSNASGVAISGPKGGGGRRRAHGRGTAISNSDADYSVPEGAQGQYRPVYKLGDADLSDDVVNVVNGEATSSKVSTDAVINNMFNRLGTRAYGPSGNLQQVARARGQYAGYRKATEARATFIRERIKAIASGAVPDNTSGANEYRAGWYNGPWGRKHADAPIIGGNRFAYNPKVTPGPYAPYRAPRDPSRLRGFAGSLASSPAMATGDVRDSISAPLGGTMALEHQVRNSNVTNNVGPTTINVNGAHDPAATAHEVGRAQGRVQGHLLRNVQGAAQ